MSNAELYDAEPQSATERLMEQTWEARRRRASCRELAVEGASATAFVAAAGALLAAGGTGTFRPAVAALLVAVYVAVVRVEFPVGAGFVVPTQLVLVPMLVMLPPQFVPVTVAVGLLISTTFDFLRGQVQARRLLSAIPDAWHAVGPALVLLLAGSPRIGFPQLPLIAGALAAGCLFDLAASLVRMPHSGAALDIRLHMRVIGLVWAVDACLAPLGFLAGIATRETPAAILFVLPLVCLLWLLAKDRSTRIDQAHRRLKLVEQERARLQSAVRRLGDAFAAKLDLGGLLEILLQGSVEALDAAAGRLALTGGPVPQELHAGDDRWLPTLRREPFPDAEPVQHVNGRVCVVTFPMRVSATPWEITGVLSFTRDDRPFERDEVVLISELISKAELAASEILAHQVFRQQAYTDPLTGLGNRRKLSDDLGAVMADGPLTQPSLLLLFDLDGFKGYNDAFGHLAGDALLARLGTKLEQTIGDRGTAYRLGGDEFCAHVGLEGQDAEQLILEAANALSESGTEFSIRASVGVVLLPHEADSPDHALQLADERMYADKRSQPTGARNQAREVLLRTMHAKQPELDEHSGRVAALAASVGRHLGLDGESLDEVTRAAELHDVGKLGIPDAILNKPGALSAGEWEFIHQHTILGERILHGAHALRPVARLVRASHERWDGAGYPDGLRGHQIPLGARIVSVCDAYEAMTANRSYRKALPHEVACRELAAAAGSQFDPAVVDAFLAVVDEAAAQDPPVAEHDAAHELAAHIRSLLGKG